MDLLLLRIWALALDEGAAWQRHTDLFPCAAAAYAWWDALPRSGDDALDAAAFDYACWATDPETTDQKLAVTRLFLRAVARFLHAISPTRRGAP